jgi:hypothetical protein
MITIWKSELPTVTGETALQLPQRSEVLCIGVDAGKLCIWYRCDDAKPKESRKFVIVETGTAHPAEPSTYLGSATLGTNTWHIFERVI